MRYPDEVKKIAYALDPECWISYRGTPISHMRAMEARRSASLREAQAQYDMDRQMRAVPIEIPSELDFREVPELLLALVDHLGLQAFRQGGAIHIEPKE